ncbi:hypothetical protein AUP07_0221 [methanogenic archaeon mixed culture ISO4-G1]|nr:hypothetical protein AUP07_0221 [methanogenic archaeon mixed culture ISO4-G1]
MVGRLGTSADVVMSESVLSSILDTMDSMLIESPMAGVLLDGDRLSDGNGEFFHIKGMCQQSSVGVCVASSEGGLEPTDADLALLKKHMPAGIMMKADVYAHQFSLYKVTDKVEDATVVFIE